MSFLVLVCLLALVCAHVYASRRPLKARSIYDGFMQYLKHCFFLAYFDVPVNDYDDAYLTDDTYSIWNAQWISFHDESRVQDAINGYNEDKESQEGDSQQGDFYYYYDSQSYYYYQYYDDEQQEEKTIFYKYDNYPVDDVILTLTEPCMTNKQDEAQTKTRFLRTAPMQQVA